MNLQINCTQDGITQYPLHKHNNYEIMLYISGTGNLHTPACDFPFSPGSIIIVPPGIEHGSVSEHGFKNISISGEFSHFFRFNSPITLSDNPQKEGTTLASLILENRFGNDKYLHSLCNSYIHFILQTLKFDDKISTAVNKIIGEITERFYDFSLNIAELLNKSGYAEDYIRSQFRKITGKTPVAFCTEIRIKHALYLTEIYSDILSLQEIAEKCGFCDYVYFSKKFKSIVGMSPAEYKKSVSKSKLNIM